jgi:hypothetical protein
VRCLPRGPSSCSESTTRLGQFTICLRGFSALESELDDRKGHRDAYRPVVRGGPVVNADGRLLLDLEYLGSVRLRPRLLRARLVVPGAVCDVGR